MKIDSGVLAIDFLDDVFPCGIAIDGYQFLAVSPSLEITLVDRWSGVLDRRCSGLPRRRRQDHRMANGKNESFAV